MCKLVGDKVVQERPRAGVRRIVGDQGVGLVRVMLLPIEYVGRRRFPYTDRVHADRPIRPRARVFLEEPLG